MTVFESVSERNPKLGGLGLDGPYDCSTNIQKVELSPLDDRIFVQKVRICSQNYGKVKIFYSHQIYLKRIKLQFQILHVEQTSTKWDCKRRNAFRLDKTHDHAVGPVYP